MTLSEVQNHALNVSRRTRPSSISLSTIARALGPSCSRNAASGIRKASSRYGTSGSSEDQYTAQDTCPFPDHVARP